MSIEGFVAYRRREYCNDIQCPIQVVLNRNVEGSDECDELREICKKKCLHTTYEFHHWLIDKGYLLVRPDKS